MQSSIRDASDVIPANKANPTFNRIIILLLLLVVVAITSIFLYHWQKNNVPQDPKGNPGKSFQAGLQAHPIIISPPGRPEKTIID